jgi:hypothetical protein
MLTSPSEVLVHHFVNWLVHWFITVITSFCGWSSGNGETKIQTPFLDDQPQKKSEDGDQPSNQPIDIMVNQYFRWRCELLDNRPIQGDCSK